MEKSLLYQIEKASFENPNLYQIESEVTNIDECCYCFSAKSSVLTVGGATIVNTTVNASTEEGDFDNLGRRPQSAVSI